MYPTSSIAHAIHVHVHVLYYALKYHAYYVNCNVLAVIIGFSPQHVRVYSTCCTTPNVPITSFDVVIFDFLFLSFNHYHMRTLYYMYIHVYTCTCTCTHMYMYMYPCSYTHSRLEGSYKWVLLSFSPCLSHWSSLSVQPQRHTQTAGDIQALSHRQLTGAVGEKELVYKQFYNLNIMRERERGSQRERERQTDRQREREREREERREKRRVDSNVPFSRRHVLALVWTLHHEVNYSQSIYIMFMEGRLNVNQTCLTCTINLKIFVVEIFS